MPEKKIARRNFEKKLSGVGYERKNVECLDTIKIDQRARLKVLRIQFTGLRFK